AVVSRNLARAVHDGEIDAALDVEESSDFVVAALEGAVVLGRGLRSRTHSRRVASALRRWLVSLEAAR
ncbi:MAG TPA: hypothetical protein VIK27_03680, partial [Candidatus Aquilonibacter sp.]